MSMKKLLIFILKYFVVSVATLFISCQKESGADNDGYSSARKEIENSKLFKTIANTTWKHEKTETYTYAGDLQRIHYSNAVIMFTGENCGDTHYYAMFNGSIRIMWNIENDELYYYLSSGDFLKLYSAEELGQWIAKLGSGGKVVRLTESQLTLQYNYGHEYRLYHFTRQYGSNGSGGSSSGVAGEMWQHGGSYSTMKMNFNDAQKQMRRVREEAAAMGIHIAPSKWETMTISM